MSDRYRYVYAVCSITSSPTAVPIMWRTCVYSMSSSVHNTALSSLITHRRPDHVADVVQHEALAVHREPQAAGAALHQRGRVAGLKAVQLAVEGLGDTARAPVAGVLGGRHRGRGAQHRARRGG